MPVEVERIIYVNRTQVFEVPVEIEKIVYINQTIEVEKVIEVPVEKIIRVTSGDDQLANRTKNEGNLTKNWDRPGYTHCEQPYVWRELIYGYKDSKVHLKAGGLGMLLERGGYQTWVCIHGRCASTGISAEIPGSAGCITKQTKSLRRGVPTANFFWSRSE